MDRTRVFKDFKKTPHEFRMLLLFQIQQSKMINLLILHLYPFVPKLKYPGSQGHTDNRIRYHKVIN